MKLYGYWRSSSSWRVRIGLHLKGLGHERVPVHLVREGGEQKMAAHRARNPMAQVPVLELAGDRFLGQSMAILTYLESVQPEPALFPSDPWLRARAMEAAEIVNAGIQPLQNLAVLRAIEAWGGDRTAWGRQVIADGLSAIESLAAATADRFLVGDTPTIADVFLIPQLYNARRFSVDLEPLPTLRRVEEACFALPAFAETHPDRQSDAQRTA